MPEQKPDFNSFKEVGVMASEMFLRDNKSEEEVDSPLDGDNETRLILPTLSPVRQTAAKYVEKD